MATHTALTRRAAAWPALVTLLAGLLLLGVAVAHAGWDANELVRTGTRFSQGDPAGTEGYDGQFFYYIARDPDPGRVAPLLDVPAYRYQRILLPLLARALTLGDAAALMWALPAIALLAHVCGVYLLARLLQHWRMSAWFALGYGLLFGCLLSIRLALPETLAFSLVIAAVWCETRGRSAWAWLFFALAVFAKETALLFVAAQGLSDLLARRGRAAIGLAASVGLPQLAFRLWLLAQFGSLGFGSGGNYATGFEWVPFMGWWRIGAYDPAWRWQLGLLYLPLLFLPILWGLWASLRAVRRQPGDFTALALGLHALVCVFLPLSIYIEPHGSLRFAVGLYLALFVFAGRHQLRRPLAYGLIYILFSAMLFVSS
ncbi:MAG: hypothetical protein KF821_02870 [Anaerolineales bacterium]|nr:hypothetical protein [Anaerolineales bacterium]